MEWLYCKVSDYTREEYESTYKKLSPSRKERIDRFAKEKDRVCSLAGELLLKKLLLEKYNLTDAVIEAESSGKPVLKNSDLYISISHSDDRVVCVADNSSVGIDIERIKPIKAGLISRVCVEEELRYVLGEKDYFKGNSLCEDSEILNRFFEIWTAKEAYFKKCGTGITDFKSVNILPLKRKIFHIDDYLIQIVI